MSYDWRANATTEELIESVGEELAEPHKAYVADAPPTERRVNAATSAIHTLAEVARRQQAQIAALEAARAPHGLPLEGTGPLPLERK